MLQQIYQWRSHLNLLDVIDQRMHNINYKSPWTIILNDDHRSNQD